MTAPTKPTYADVRSIHNAFRMAASTAVISLAVVVALAFDQSRLLLAVPIGQAWYLHAAVRLRQAGDDAVRTWTFDLGVAVAMVVAGSGWEPVLVGIVFMTAWAVFLAAPGHRRNLAVRGAAAMGLAIAIDGIAPSTATASQTLVMAAIAGAIWLVPVAFVVPSLRRRVQPLIDRLTDFLDAASRDARLIRRLPAAIYRAKVDGTIVESNPAMERLLATTSHVGPVAEEEKHAEFVRKLWEDGKVEGVVKERTTVDGSIRFLVEAAYPLFDARGRMTHYEGVIEDITEIKQAQRGAEEATRSIQAQIAHHQTLVQLATRLHRTKTDFVPPEAIQHIEEVVGSPVSIVDDRLTGETGDRDIDVPIIVGGRTVGGLLVSNPPSVGTAGWMTLRAAAEMIGGFWERTSARARLEQLVESKDAFLASISHELRTPLTSILGFAEVLLGDEGMDTESRELVEILNGQAIEMAALIEDLLVASRAELDRLAVVATDIDLDAEIRSIVASLGRYAGAKPVSVDLERGLEVSADPIRMRQIIRNLLTNAFRYGGSRITVRTRHDGAAIRIVVCDDGDPIPDADVEKIFEPYQRMQQLVVGPSSVGLGLSVSRTLAELMGGSLDYTHSDGESMFTLRLLPSAFERAG